MSQMSDYLEKMLLNAVFKNTAYNANQTWIALFNVAPSDAGGGTEIPATTAYVRQQVLPAAWTVHSAESGGGQVVPNTSAVTFPVANADYPGNVVAVGIYDASTSGNLLVWANLQANKDIGNGDQFSFPANDLNTIFR